MNIKSSCMGLLAYVKSKKLKRVYGYLFSIHLNLNRPILNFGQKVKINLPYFVLSSYNNEILLTPK